jgi:hypothetical protein
MSAFTNVDYAGCVVWHRDNGSFVVDDYGVLIELRHDTGHTEAIRFKAAQLLEFLTWDAVHSDALSLR